MSYTRILRAYTSGKYKAYLFTGKHRYTLEILDLKRKTLKVHTFDSSMLSSSLFKASYRFFLQYTLVNGDQRLSHYV
jgi:hypothetical protein